MVTIGVVSDTHLPRFGRALPPPLVAALAAARVERILHAGDLTEAFVLDLLGAIAPVQAVAGNNDRGEWADALPDRLVLEIEGARIGLTHGHLGRGRTTPDRARSTFESDGVDLVVFGHSHQPLWAPGSPGRPALLNPGSPTDRRREPSCSYAILRIERGEDGRPAIDARIERIGR